MYSIAGATFGIFSDQNCSNQIGTLTTNENGETNEVEVTAGTVYIKELSVLKGYKLDTTVHSLKVEAGKPADKNVSDVPKVTATQEDLYKIDMETGKAAAQKAKEVADSAKRHIDLRVAKRDLNDQYRQVGEKYFEDPMDFPQAEYIALFKIIEKLRGDIEILKQEIEGEEDEFEDGEDIEE